VYLPARLIDHLPAGTPVTVARLGGDAADSIAGRIGAVNPKAEFTPRAALTEEERADLLFGVRIEVDDPPATLRPGLPVVVRIPGTPAD
jgi:HlyD family secretion protein